MRLTDDNLVKFQAHLKGFRCSCCGNKSYTIFREVYHALALNPEYRFGNKFLDEFCAHPMLMISCQHCGHVSFFDAIHLGILPPLSDDAGATADNDPTK